MKPLLLSTFLSLFIITIASHPRTLFSDYHYILGQKISADDVEPADNYEFQVLLEEDEALGLVLKGCDEVLLQKVELTPDEKQKLEHRIKARFNEDAFDVYIGKKDGEVERYAIITDEMGCFHPITYIMSTRADGKIEQVAIMIYRESRGKDVIKKRFLHQYQGKSVNNAIRINKDIINVTGATVSVRGLNRGIRKMLAVLDAFFLHHNLKIRPKPQITVANQVKEKGEQETFAQTYYSLGDYVEIVLTGITEKNASNAFKEAFKEVDRLNKVLNPDLKSSEIAKINRKAWKKPKKCRRELFNIIDKSLSYGDLTNGRFNITEGYLLTFGEKKPEDIEQTFKAASYKNVVIDSKKEEKLTIFLKDRRTKIDLSPVSKGYVVDKVFDVLKNSGISQLLVSFGGVIRVAGNPPDAPGWQIAIPDPENKGESIGFLNLRDGAIAISGEYENSLMRNREEFTHLLDANIHGTFNPDLIKSIVVAASAFDADAIASAAHLSGLNDDMALVDRIPLAEGINLYKRMDGSIEIEISGGMRKHFAQKREQISAQRIRQACAF
ncbi:MAG: FMN-binding protein [Candidatus Scalindua sp. AMX11]|nr:MAG: FMN-binding protein [Candidatus Scalindua sp.]NOG84854.1 FMN-binding protein [Planctomycetota bacterium]RZV84924.1 MAG: FMN-binding protein [Candidatus Scalindua sp. SCAELEC01]TDE65084.1 MAG: FMN-binding protein [Candidatus Scalindua sp. AMX11]GJQ59477.1 MAG: hypothetical protein SCALA701_22780 [Candidatus Scalindua sp.]